MMFLKRFPQIEEVDKKSKNKSKNKTYFKENKTKYMHLYGLHNYNNKLVKYEKSALIAYTYLDRTVVMESYTQMGKS